MTTRSTTMSVSTLCYDSQRMLLSVMFMRFHIVTCCSLVKRCVSSRLLGSKRVKQHSSCIAMMPATGTRPTRVTMTMPPLAGRYKRRRLSEKTPAAAVSPLYCERPGHRTTMQHDHAVDDEASVDPAAQLLSSMHPEVQQTVVQLGVSSLSMSTSERVSFPLCQCYAFIPGSDDALRHFTGGHAAGCHYVCSGTKQLRMSMSMHEADMCQGKLPGNYMSRTANLIRDHVKPGVPSHLVAIDKQSSVVLDAMPPALRAWTARPMTGHCAVLGILSTPSCSRSPCCAECA